MFCSRGLLGQVVIEWRWWSWYARNLHLALGAAERKSVAWSSPFTLEEPSIAFAARKAQFPHRVQFDVTQGGFRFSNEVVASFSKVPCTALRIGLSASSIYLSELFRRPQAVEHSLEHTDHGVVHSPFHALQRPSQFVTRDDAHYSALAPLMFAEPFFEHSARDADD